MNEHDTLNPSFDPIATRQFLEELWPDTIDESRRLLIWTLPGKLSAWCTDIDGALRVAERAAPHSDVYIGCGLGPAGVSTRKRARNEEVQAIPGLWCDLDYADSAHKKQNLPTRAEAEAFIGQISLICAPTLIVHSGHGFQLWWLFDEPWYFGDGDRERAAALMRAWYARIRTMAVAHGWDVDATVDLARVMRVPGTINHKNGKPVPVALLATSGPRRSVAAWLTLAAAAVEVPPSTVSTPRISAARADAGSLALSAEAEPPVEKLTVLLTNDERFEAAWDRKGRGQGQDGSASAWDMRLANVAVRAGWSAQEVTNLLIASRRKHGDDLKLREDYYRRTIDKASTDPPTWPPSATAPIEGEGPIIEIGRRAAFQVAEEGWRRVATKNADHPQYFVHGTGSVRLTTLPKGSSSLLSLTPMGRLEVSDALDRAVRWSLGGKSPAKLEASAEGRAVVAAALQVHPLPLPSLRGLVYQPFLAPDGRLVASSGYDPATEFYLQLAPQLEGIEPMRHLVSAVSVIRELFRDFPFKDAASEANAIAALLTPFARTMFPEMITPLFVFDATTPRSGKGLLVRVVNIVHNGREPAPSPLPLGRYSEEEAEKQTLAIFRKGEPFVFYDNVKGHLDSAVLEKTLTTPVFSGRVLGKSTIEEYLQRKNWYLTGNGLTVGKDMAGRVVPIVLAPNTEYPEERSDFLHPDLPAWVFGHRAELIKACLGIVVAWVSAGQPAGDETLGAYEQWASVLGGVLGFAGIRGFLTNRASYLSTHDEDTSWWDTTVEMWDEARGHFSDSEPVTAAELMRLIGEHGDLLPVERTWHSETEKQPEFTRALAKLDGAVRSGLRIERVTDQDGKPKKHPRNRQVLWRIRPSQPTPVPVDAPTRCTCSGCSACGARCAVLLPEDRRTLGLCRHCSADKR